MIGSLQNHSFADHATGYGRVNDLRQSSDTDVSATAARQVDRNQQAGDRQQLSEEEKQQVHQLKQRDHEVRAHERAHMAAGAGMVQGGASFTFQRGPDGRMYAVGGEVKVDTSAESDPDQTIRKMQQVKRAALAPAEPSGADQSVAARASQVEAQARQETSKFEQADTQAEKAGDHQGRPVTGAMPGRRPYSAETVGQTLNIAI
jgi:hypothetical protein